MNQQNELIPITTGELLKQRRTERKLSLPAVAKAVGLDRKLLEAIEEDRPVDIAPVYRTGYIRTYARHLEIPEDEIQQMVSVFEEAPPPVQNIFSEPPIRNHAEKWLRATSYVLASLLIGTLAWQLTHEAVRLSQDGSGLQNAAEGPAVEQIQSRQQADDYRATVKASIAPLGVLHDNNAEGLDTAEQAWAAVSRQTLPEGEIRMKVSVSADSWVEISDANGKQLEMDLLRGGSDMAYHGKPPFRILLGRASAVLLYIDGEPVDLAAYKQDDVAQLTWPQEKQ